MTQRTYILNDTEVKLTGRVAERFSSGGLRQELVEVTPAREQDGSWTKWVLEKTLFTIKPAPRP